LYAILCIAGKPCFDDIVNCLDVASFICGGKMPEMEAQCRKTCGICK